MQILYKGLKPQKTVNFNGKKYIFTPSCDIEDEKAQRFFTSPARLGEYSPVVEIENKPPENKASDIPSEPEQKPLYRCEVCGKTYKYRVALAGHRKSHEETK